MRKIRESRKSLFLALMLTLMMVFTMGGFSHATEQGDGAAPGDAQVQQDQQDPDQAGTGGEPADEESAQPPAGQEEPAADEGDLDKDSKTGASPEKGEQGEPQTEGQEGEAEGGDAQDPPAQGEGGDQSFFEPEEAVVDTSDAEPVDEACDFLVKKESTIAAYSFADNTLTITEGKVAIKNKPDVPISAQHIVVAGDATIVLDGVVIETLDSSLSILSSPIRIAPGVRAKLVLNEGSVNKVSGTSLTHDGYKTSGVAGIEVGIDEIDGYATNLSTLIISGKGKLIAQGGSNAAGIGGSKALSSKAAHGDIIINSGVIEAIGGDGGAGIGTAANMNSQLSCGSYKSSFQWGKIVINGGEITARGNGSGAGIGGGNHVDSGDVNINGGTIYAEGASGIGSGLGSHDNNSDTKGPGNYYATVTINGGKITAVASGDDNWGGAGIGGGGYCDAKVVITGGDITAYGGSCQEVGQPGYAKDHNAFHHGGAGIGGGYMGHANITISGDPVIHAYAGYSSAAGIGSGGTPNDRGGASTGRSRNAELTYLTGTDISISGSPTIYAYAYPKDESIANYPDLLDSDRVVNARGGAGIGGGAGADKVNITITGGTIEAYGAPSNETDKFGGAGIGSGLYAANLNVPGQAAGSSKAIEKEKYQSTTTVNISITGGNVLAVGGWGAAGVGSGARNIFAATIELDLKAPGKDGAELEAYADGTKFAIDTRDLQDDGTTKSYLDGRTVDGYILQGTFVHEGEIGDYEQNPEGLKSIFVSNDATQDPQDQENRGKELTQMPDSYRSYATNVDSAGSYTVYTDEESIGHGEGRFFSVCTRDVYAEENVSKNMVQYTVEKDGFSDNFYLFPVKTVVIKKTVKDSLDGDPSYVNGTVYFSIQQKDDGQFLKKGDGSQWIESIEIKDGQPQSKAYFINVPDKTFDVLEVDANGARIDTGANGIPFGSAVLRKVRTKHAGGSDNNAIIDDDHWSDQVEVINTYSTKGMELKLKKILPVAFEAADGANSTVVFKVSMPDPENADKLLYENHFSFVFTGAGDQEQTITLPGISGAETLVVEETYTAGYKAKDGGKKVVDLTQADKSKPIEVSFENEFNDDVSFKEGVINKYSNKTYVEPNAGSGAADGE